MSSNGSSSSVLQEPIQTFELKIQLRAYTHSVSPMEMPNLIQAALEGDGVHCLFHAGSWMPMVKGFKYDKNDRPTCPVCFEEIEQGKLVARTPCNHLYHKTCMTHWFRRRAIMFRPTCPSCRALVPVTYKFQRSADILSKPKLDDHGEVYYERTMIPQSGKHHNSLYFSKRIT